MARRLCFGFRFSLQICHEPRDVLSPPNVLVGDPRTGFPGKPGKIEVTAEAVAKGSGEDRAKQSLSISDNGSGILADKLKDVFRPFYTTKAEGTGLGLYITKQLVEKIRGRIDVESELGRGTTFIVSLPA